MDHNDLEKLGTSQLLCIKGDIENILSERTFNIAEEEKRKAENELFEKLSSRGTNIMDKYWKCEEHEKYHKINIGTNLLAGEPVPCYFFDETCWWGRHLNRLHNFDGTMYKLTFTEDIMICQVCYDNGNYIQEPEEYVSGRLELLGKVCTQKDNTVKVFAE